MELDILDIYQKLEENEFMNLENTYPEANEAVKEADYDRKEDFY